MKFLTIITIFISFISCSKKAEIIVLIKDEPEEISSTRAYFENMEKDKSGIPIKISNILKKDFGSPLNNKYVKNNIKSMVHSLNVKTKEGYIAHRSKYYKDNICDIQKAMKTDIKSFTQASLYLKVLEMDADYWRLNQVEIFLDKRFKDEKHFKKSFRDIAKMYCQ